MAFDRESGPSTSCPPCHRTQEVGRGVSLSFLVSYVLAYHKIQNKMVMRKGAGAGGLRMLKADFLQSGD